MTKNKIYDPQLLISPDMKVFELIDSYPSLLSIFLRLNISLPFGDISVEEICRRDGYPVELFLILCGMHLSKTYRPDSEQLSTDMLQGVVN